MIRVKILVIYNYLVEGRSHGRTYLSLISSFVYILTIHGAVYIKNIPLYTYAKSLCYINPEIVHPEIVHLFIVSYIN